jgi:hypothetical protein
MSTFWRSKSKIENQKSATIGTKDGSFLACGLSRTNPVLKLMEFVGFSRVDEQVLIRAGTALSGGVE